MARQTGVVTATKLNVRPRPSTQGAPLGSASRGDRLEVLGREGLWYRVRWQGREGYAHGDFVRIVEQNPSSGFLHEQAAFQEVPLAPAEPIPMRPGMSAAQRQTAATWNAYGGLLQPLCEQTEIEPAAAVAVLLVESSGKGFGPDGRMVIRFENHTFERQWGSAGRGTFARHFRYRSGQPWTQHQFCPAPGAGWQKCHGSQADEWRVFTFARGLSEPAALASISMGAPQIMGFNHARIGYDSAREMFDRFSADIRYHLLGLFDFIVGPGTTSPMLEALQRNRFEGFASHYNGNGQAAKYGHRIAVYHAAFRGI